jgi:hypothetical protein
MSFDLPAPPAPQIRANTQSLIKMRSFWGEVLQGWHIEMIVIIVETQQKIYILQS